MKHSRDSSVTSLSNIPISKLKNYYNVDYYEFRHVINEENAIEIRDFTDEPSFKVKLPNIKNNNSQNHFGENPENYRTENNYSLAYNKSMPENYQEYIDHSLYKLENSEINLLKEKKKLDLNFDNMKKDHIFLNRYNLTYQAIIKKSNFLLQENRKLEKEFSSMKYFNENKIENLEKKRDILIKDINEHTQDMVIYNNKWKDLNLKRIEQQKNVLQTDFKSSIFRDDNQSNNIFKNNNNQSSNIFKNDYPKSKDFGRNSPIDKLMKKISHLENKVAKSNLEESNFNQYMKCTSCLKKDEIIKNLQNELKKVKSSFNKIPPNKNNNTFLKNIPEQKTNYFQQISYRNQVIPNTQNSPQIIYQKPNHIYQTPQNYKIIQNTNPNIYQTNTIYPNTQKVYQHQQIVQTNGYNKIPQRQPRTLKEYLLNNVPNNTNNNQPTSYRPRTQSLNNTISRKILRDPSTPQKKLKLIKTYTDHTSVSPVKNLKTRNSIHSLQNDHIRKPIKLRESQKVTYIKRSSEDFKNSLIRNSIRNSVVIKNSKFNDNPVNFVDFYPRDKKNIILKDNTNNRDSEILNTSNLLNSVKNSLEDDLMRIRDQFDSNKKISFNDPKMENNYKNLKDKEVINRIEFLKKPENDVKLSYDSDNNEDIMNLITAKRLSKISLQNSNSFGSYGVKNVLGHKISNNQNNKFSEYY